MPASDSFSFEDGIFTVSCMATLPLRMRVSMSAMGSVIVMLPPLSPARLRHTGNLARMSKVAQAYATQPELAEHGARPSTPAAPGVRLHLVLGLALLLLDESLLGHSYCPSRRNGNPKAASRARPSSLVRAVVTIVMSMPRGVSTLS